MLFSHCTAGTAPHRFHSGFEELLELDIAASVVVRGRPSEIYIFLQRDLSRKASFRRRPDHPRINRVCESLCATLGNNIKLIQFAWYRGFPLAKKRPPESNFEASRYLPSSSRSRFLPPIRASANRLYALRVGIDRIFDSFFPNTADFQSGEIFITKYRSLAPGYCHGRVVSSLPSTYYSYDENPN